jgi:hypothetical protein
LELASRDTGHSRPISALAEAIERAIEEAEPLVEDAGQDNGLGTLARFRRASSP